MMNETTMEKPVINPSPVRQEASICLETAGRRDQDDSGSVLSVLVLALVCLGAAHLAVKEFFPNPVFWIIGASIIVAVGLVWIVIRKDYFGFLLALFVCVHFNFAEYQGGLWAYVLCAVMLAGSFLCRSEITLSSVPNVFNLFVFVFLFMQILGTMLNPYSLVCNIQASIVAVAQVLAFYLCASQKMTMPKLKRFLSIWFLVACWGFVMGLNQRYQWLITPSPLLPQREYLGGVFGHVLKLAHVPAASFGSGELFGEYFCIVFAFSMVVFCHMKELKGLQIRKLFPVVMIFVSLTGIVMGAARSAVVLAVVGMFYITFLDFIVAPSVRSLCHSAIVVGTLSVATILLFNFGSYVFLDRMVDDFQQLNPSKMTMSSVVSGQSINRGKLFVNAWKRITHESWLVGYGYNLPVNNKISIGFQRVEVRDLHNLYLSLPFFYGWFGAIAYVLLLLGTWFQIYIRYMREARKASTYLTPIALGFSVLWCIFILDQYKICVTRNPNYFLLTWMWLGLTHAVANSMDTRPSSAKDSS